jgi:2,3-dihydroxyphenylpropionate 1,2-dioxygenase
MGEVVLGVGASHSTLMNTHWDQVRNVTGAKRFRDALYTARDEIAVARPDVAVIVGSNHFRGVWLDLVPPFALGVGEVISSGEAGTPKGPQRTDVEFAQALAEGLVSRGTEVAISARMQIDHGQSHAIQYLLDGIELPVVPLMVNVFATPLPLLSRCAQLGRNLADTVRDMADGRRVVVIASGGLSHQLPWPSRWQDPRTEDEEFLVQAWLNGRGDWERYDARRRQIITTARPVIFSDFDAEFLGRLERGELEHYLPWTSEQIEVAAGNGAQELRTWLTMASALGFVPGRQLAYAAMHEWLTGMAVAVLDPAVAHA